MTEQDCQAEAERYSDSAFYRSILEQARDIILVIAVDGSIIDANRAAVEAYGYSLAELRCLRVHDLRPAELRAIINEQINRAKEEGILFRSVHLRRDGRRFPVEVNSQWIQLAESGAIVSIVRDISEAVDFETALKQKEESTRHLNSELMIAHEELTATHEELTASEEELRQQFDELLTREDAIRRQNSILTSFHDTALGLMHRLDPKGLLKMIVAGAAELVGTPHAFIYRLDRQRDIFYRSHGLGLYANDIGREISVNEGIVGAVYRTGQPVVVNDYPTWRQRYAASAQFAELTAVLQIPLTSEGKVIGSIGLAYSGGEKKFGKTEIEILGQFAELASISLDNAILVASYEKELQERRQAEEDLQNSEVKYRAIFEAANDGILIYDWINDTILDVNEKACELYGYTRTEILSGTFSFVSSGESPYSEKEARQRLLRAIAGEPQLFEWQSQHRDGHLVWIEVSLKRALIGRDDQILAIVRDISERKAQEQAIWRLAYYDSLTGLPNRAYLQEQLAKELKKAVRRGEVSGTVLHVGMDDLKMINDTLGYSYGDDVIKKAGAYILAEAGENSLVARVGGDEFIVLLSDKNDRQKVEQIARDMVNLLSRDYDSGESRIHISASIGIAHYPVDGDTVEEVLKKVGLALYVAKANGKNTWRFYEANLQRLAFENLMLKRGLRDSIEREELSLHYQPLIDPQSGCVVSFEALLRWTSPTHGRVQPSRFIPLAEESDTILKIGKWVLEEACRFAHKLASMGKGHIRVSVNVSSRQLVADNFVTTVCEAIASAGINPNQLEVEITESMLIACMEDSTRKLEELRDIGVRLSLDDFGTGYSSLTYLRNLPVGTLKIDKSFIDRIISDAGQSQFICSIINMAHTLQLMVVAEGVETEEQLEKLIECQCDIIQGYIFSRPISEREAILFIERCGSTVP